MSNFKQLMQVSRRNFTKFIHHEEFLNELHKHDGILSMMNPQRHLYAKEVDLKNYPDKVIDSQFIRPPKLEHKLDKIVRTDGIYRVEEFLKLHDNDQFLKNIPQPSPESLAKFPGYKPPSQDEFLLKKGKETGAKFITGSSSITSAMQHIYFMISNFKSPDITGLGKNYDSQNMNYMVAYRKPTTIVLRKLDNNMYAIDGDNGLLPSSNVALTDMGIVLESMFTTDKDLFLRVMDPKLPLSPKDAEALQTSSRSYRYRQLGNILVRSQIDCEGIGDDGDYFVFEIKTRACAPIRYDVKNYKEYLDYRIETRLGLHSSFEREYFDLCRSIMMKYFFQVKMGRMDGAFIGYHNTSELFGFEYLKLEEIEKRLFGHREFADQIFRTCTYLLEDILQDVIKIFPDDPMIKVGFYANYKHDELLITIERFDKMAGWKDSSMKIEGIEDEFDYYEAFHPGKTAYTLGRRMYPYINGILQKEPVFLETGDRFSVKQLKYEKGIMGFNEYMYFLHSAYKIDTIVHNRDFAGLWKKFNDFHFYRKPLYRESSI